MDWIDLNPDPIHVKREREKARALRKSNWWKSRIADGTCHYCGKKVGAENLTLDHVVPCCHECNASKKHYTPAEQILDTLFPNGVESDTETHHESEI